LPLILSNRIEVKERVDGNGLLYEEDNKIDLAKNIKILKDNQLRQKMSVIGIEKIKNKFSWRSIAESRITDYRKALLKENL
jgi:glycosyltransferase involved in cell wall biosynthesis